jgi:uncharacterized metal-binding protein
MKRCAVCGVYRCREGAADAPDFCPQTSDRQILEESLAQYTDENSRIARVAAMVEAEGYGAWPRVREIMEFAHRLDYQTIGLAFCVGLREEARLFARILENNGFTVYSAICKAGSVDKKEIGVINQLNPGKFEAMCNPIAQAALLDDAGSQLNVILGLCVGHDTLFLKHSKAPATVLAVKDRVLAHNPLGALYAGHYYGKKLNNIFSDRENK